MQAERAVRARLAPAYYTVYSIVCAGFLVHESSDPWLGPYSMEYVAGLIVLGLGFLVPVMVRRFYGGVELTSRRLAFSIVPWLVVLSVIYNVVSFVYYHSQEHGFDPFLQTPPPAFLQSVTTPKQPGTVRVLALGGSTTADQDLAPAARYPAVLEDLLRKASAPSSGNIEVLNAGMDWYTTKHSLIDYATRLTDWRPDVAIVLHGINDLARSFDDPDFSAGPYNSDWSNYYGPASAAEMPMTLEAFLVRPVLGVWLSFWRVREADFGLDRYVSLDDYPRHYRHLIQDLKRDHVVVVLASQPMLLKDVMSADERAVLQFGKMFFKTPINRFESRYASPRSLKRALDAINGVTRDVAQQEGVTFVDLASRIPRDLAHFTDEVHFTERGAREVAEIITATLVDAKMIERFHP